MNILIVTLVLATDIAKELPATDNAASKNLSVLTHWNQVDKSGIAARCQDAGRNMSFINRIWRYAFQKNRIFHSTY